MDIKDWLIVGAVGLAWLNRDKLKQALNPFDDKNAVNTAANKVLGYDNQTESIGTAAYVIAQQVRKKLGLSYDKTTDADYGQRKKSKFKPSAATAKAQAKTAPTVNKINKTLFPAIAAGARPRTKSPYVEG